MIVFVIQFTPFNWFFGRLFFIRFYYDQSKAVYICMTKSISFTLHVSMTILTSHRLKSLAVAIMIHTDTDTIGWPEAVKYKYDRSIGHGIKLCFESRYWIQWWNRGNTGSNNPALTTKEHWNWPTFGQDMNFSRGLERFAWWPKYMKKHRKIRTMHWIDWQNISNTLATLFASKVTTAMLCNERLCL